MGIKRKPIYFALNIKLLAKGVKNEKDDNSKLY